MMNTKQFYPIGYLRILGQRYFLINPSPVPEFDGIGRCFLVIPIQPKKIQDVGNKWKNIYPCPRIVISTEWSLEFDVTIKPILCEQPEDILDTLFDEMTNKQGALK